MLTSEVLQMAAEKRRNIWKEFEYTGELTVSDCVSTETVNLEESRFLRLFFSLSNKQYAYKEACFVSVPSMRRLKQCSCLCLTKRVTVTSRLHKHLCIMFQYCPTASSLTSSCSNYQRLSCNF